VNGDGDLPGLPALINWFDAHWLPVSRTLPARFAAHWLNKYSSCCIFIEKTYCGSCRGEDRDVEKPDIVIANLGYPRIGERLEGISALEAYRAGNIGERELEERLMAVRLARLLKQQEAGVDWIPVGDFALYDHVLDHSIAFGLVPERFAEAAARGPAALAFAMAEGAPGAAACRTKPWYGTPYQYIVPEPAAFTAPRLVHNPWAEAFREARAHLQALPVPVMIGPYTFAKLAEGLPPEEALERIAPVYAQALRGLHEAGAAWVQLEEPELARAVPPRHWPLIERTYRALHDAAPPLRLMLQLTFGLPDECARLLELPVAGIGLDFAADGGRALEAVAKHGFPAARVLGVGIVDGRSVWRSDLTAACALLENLRRLIPQVRLALQPSCSLLHAPVSLGPGTPPRGLPRHALAFADEKLGELRVLRTALTEGRDAVKLDLTDSDVLQDMLRVLLPAAVPDGGVPVEHAWVQACGPACIRPAISGKPAALAAGRRHAAAGMASGTA
jgi:5-methyltetrahydropteroyltriglutamate--homocysteine methyltransferase